jgi:hypothetical protein
LRDKNRDPVPSTELRLALTDFICGEYASSFEDVDDHLVVSSMSLCEYLARAESSQNMSDKRISRLSKSDTLPQTKLARRRGPTPEQLRSEDEREFEKAEKKDEKLQDNHTLHSKNIKDFLSDRSHTYCTAWTTIISKEILSGLVDGNQ